MPSEDKCYRCGGTREAHERGWKVHPFVTPAPDQPLTPHDGGA